MTIIEATRLMRDGKKVFRPSWADEYQTCNLDYCWSRGDIYFFALKDYNSDIPSHTWLTVSDIEANDWQEWEDKR